MNKTNEWDGREVMRGTGQYDAELGPVRLDVEWSPWTAGHGPLGHFWYVRGCVGGRPVSWGWVDYDVGRRLQDEGFYDDEVRLGLTAGFEGWVDDGRVRIDIHARPTTARQQGILREVLDAYGGRAVLTALPSGELTLRPGYRWWAVSPELLGGRGCRPVRRRTLMARRGVISEVTRWILDGHRGSTAISQDASPGGL
ncbi:MAG: hypothetical protein HKN73_09155, partial [Gemmatimonadetes bacterium]|nr:hypothetical protein [Gemmatimonadota bacterium]